jgi:hypothetical protein
MSMSNLMLPVTTGVGAPSAARRAASAALCAATPLSDASIGCASGAILA